MKKQERNAHFVNSLESLKPNKNFAKKEKLRQKRIEKDAKDEWPPLRREKEKALKAAKKEAAKPVKASAKSLKANKADASATAAKKEKKKSASKATPAAPTPAKSGKAAKKLKSKLSQRRVVNEIANAATGRESLLKVQARALVQKKKQQQAAEAKKSAKKAHGAVADKKSSAKQIAAKAKVVATASAGGRRASVKVEKKTASHDASDELDATMAEAQAPLLSRSEMERALLQRTICGDEHADHHAGQGDVREDPTLYPALAFYDDYAEKRSGDTVSEDQVLSQANSYFRDVRRRERELNLTAVRHIAKMKAVNRKGGDKDGFRYVVPRNTKQLVRQMMLNGAQRSMEADVNPDSLASTFLGDDVEAQVSDKPQRRRRKRSSTLSDFYQFQVSKRWTQNAEKFLKRGRANKSMFEDKKRQRSIRKM